jgi:hypothetical protein
MKILRNWIMSLAIVATVGGSLMAVALPQTAFAKCNGGFLGFPAWYDGLTVSEEDCNIKSPDAVGGLSNFIWHIVLNVVSIGLVGAGYVAAFFIMYGGFLFLTSQGDANNAATARSTMLDATIGLAISMASVALVNFIAQGIGF